MMNRLIAPAFDIPERNDNYTGTKPRLLDLVRNTMRKVAGSTQNSVLRKNPPDELDRALSGTF